MKRRGKSSPRDWRQFRHGKPYREQGQVGRGTFLSGKEGLTLILSSSGYGLLEAHGNVGPRGIIASVGIELTFDPAKTEPGLSTFAEIFWPVDQQFFEIRP